jgi:hypothetical protein
MAKATKLIRVGVDIHHKKVDRNGRKTEFRYSYNNLKTLMPLGWDGWVDCHVALPLPFDLQLIKTNSASHVKIGWWTGSYWEGLRLKPNETVYKWKWKEKLE